MSDPAWYVAPRVLVDRYAEFFPRSNQSFTERINATTRLVIYCSAALLLYNRDLRILIIAAVIIVLLALGHRAAGIDSGAPAPPSTAVVTEAETRSTACYNHSSKENPFGNPSMLDVGTGKLPMCNASDPSVKAAIDQNYNDGFFRDVSDVWGGNASMRQWTTLPDTSMLPDTPGFAKWLYDPDKKTCKDDPAACTGSR